MKILICSTLFPPSIGGMESVMSILAHELLSAGHEVVVVTRTGGGSESELPFEVYRRPSARELLRLVAWSDVCLHACVSIVESWPLVFLRRPLIVLHHTWYRRPDGKVGWRDRIKGLLCRTATNIAVSNAIADHIPAPCEVLPNPYRDDIFNVAPGTQQETDLAFVGRLVSDKGVDLLLRAVHELGGRNLFPRLTVVGGGPEDGALKSLATELGIESRVTFTGELPPHKVAEILRVHRILVIPSRWEEPFGVVALEALGCGRMVAASDGGGLREAIGPRGHTFRRGDVASLTELLANLLRHPVGGEMRSLSREVIEHLERHRPKIVADRLLSIINSAVIHR